MGGGGEVCACEGEAEGEEKGEGDEEGRVGEMVHIGVLEWEGFMRGV